MGLISRIVTFVTGTSASAVEVNAEFDNIIATVNGNLDTSNLSGSAGITNAQLVDIAMTKVLDLADDIATYIATTTPGDTVTPSLPATLAEEMRRLRYRISANRTYQTSIFYMDASSVATAAGWFEPPIVGPNLLQNPGFEARSGATPTAPNSWTLVGTPSAINAEAAAFATYGLFKRSLNVVTDAANEGISIVVPGLKTGVKYLVGMAYTLTDNGTVAGVLRLSTTNGLVAGAYQNLILDAATEAAATVVVTQGIVNAQSPAVSMTVSITATQAGADFNILEVWMYELSDGYPVDLPSIPMQTATDNAQATLPTTWTGSTWNYETRTQLSLSQYVPFSGYRLIYEVVLSATSDVTSDDNHKHVFQLQLDSGSGVSTVQGPFIHTIDANGAANFNSGKIVSMRHVVDNPTPGLTYAFTVQVGAYNGGGDHSQVFLNPLLHTLQSVSTARLIVERI